MIKGYHADNGIFNDLEFMEELLNNQQNIKFSGDSGSHQVRSAERAIKTVVIVTRTMLMHAAIIFPKDTLSTDIFPMEMDYAKWV